MKTKNLESIFTRIRAICRTEYIFFNGQRVARHDLYDYVDFYVGDHLSSTRLDTDVFGNPLDDSDYYPFGGERAVLSNSSNHYKFTSMERDSESGLDHTLFRQYSSTQGRWMTPDPAGLAAADLGNPQSWNRYAYVRNNPLSSIDPLGLCDVNARASDEEGNISVLCADDGGGGGGGGDDTGGGHAWWSSGIISPGSCVDIYVDGVYFGNSCGGGPMPVGGDRGNGSGSGDGSAPNPPVKAANNGATIGAAPPAHWYKNPCVTSALAKGALSVGVDAIGLIPEAGGVARVIGHQAGFVGVVADQAGSRVIKAVGASTSTVQGLNGLFDTSPTGLLSTGLTVAGFIPGLGQLASGASIVVDAVKTGMEVAQCHP